MKKIILSIIIVLVIFSLWFMYNKYISPTRIALVRFRDFQYYTFMEVNRNPFIKIDRIELNEESITNLNKYTAVYLFGMGLRLNPVQKESIDRAINRGVKVYTYAATSTESDVNNLPSESLEYIEGYLQNGGRRNIAKLINYTRRVFDNKKLFSNEIKEPFRIPFDVLFHLGDETFFETYKDYQNFYKEKGFYNEDAHNIALVTTNIGPRNANRNHVDMIIKSLEEKGFNVYPLSGFSKRMKYLKEINPSLVILMPHGRFMPGNTDASVEWLSKNNIPLVCPITIFEPYEEWLTDQRGMSGGILSQSIVVPELDGGIYPYVLGAQFENEMGLYVFDGIKNRIDRFTNLIQKSLNLKDKPNSEKKIAIYYYKGPGLNSMVAGGMEVAPSLLNLLRKLKEEGYNTGVLPENEDELLEIINRDGPVLGAYAEGSIQNFLNEGNPEFINVKDYLEWCKNNLEYDMYQDVVRDYGEAPGQYMSLQKDGNTYIAVARVQFGNIVLLPQPMPAYGDNEFELIHGANQAPPHTYIASYLWMREGFQADAVMHFGTHGSLEFTPWKQVALSEYDWPDALIGGLPHFYIYIINNIGEAVIAKRRSYAALVSHLTPPFSEADLYGELNTLHDRLHWYYSADNEALKAEYKNSIRNDVISLDLHKDLGWDNFEDMELTDELIDIIHDYIHILEEEKITLGLYTLGNPYEEESIYETAKLMAIDPLSYNMAKLDVIDGKVSSEKVDNAHYFDEVYRKRAFEIIDKILLEDASPDKFIDDDKLRFLYEWQKNNRPVDSDDLMMEMMQFSELSSYSLEIEKDNKDDEEKVLRMKELILNIAPSSEKRNFIMSLQDERNFNRALVLLTPEGMEQAKRVSRFIPKMQESIQIAEDKEVQELLKLMRTDKVKKLVFDYMEDDEVVEKILKEEEYLKKAMLKKLVSDNYNSFLFLAINSNKLNENLKQWNLSKLREFNLVINKYLQNRELFQNENTFNTKNSEAVFGIMTSDKSIKLLNESIILADEYADIIIENDRERAHTIQTIKETIFSVKSYYEGIKNSPLLELDSVINALNGGYILPSSGGDPISNPLSIPTGRNLYSIDAEKTPTTEAWNVGKDLADKLITAQINATGKFPEKVAFTLWGGEFIRAQGITIAQIFYLLGVEPVRNSRGVVHDVRLIPINELNRPRVDVVVQTSGQFRDIAASRIYLINKAVRLASEARDDGDFRNYVREGTIAAEEVMREKGFSPLEARQFSTARVFGGVGGNYGTAIGGLVESGDRWEDDKEITDRYLMNMGAIYTEENWGHFREGIFEAALQNTQAVVHPRSSNTWGPLSLDHVYEFMGGLNATIRNVTGNDPEAFFNDLRNRHNPNVQGVKEAIWVETRSTLYNPKYIQALQEGGASSANVFATTFRNTYGWNVMKPDAIDNELWEGLYKIYIQDEYDLNLEEYFREKNPYALQEMTAVMLETIRKGYWDADVDIIKTLSELHAKLVKDHKPGCSGFVCDNLKLREMISDNISSELKESYRNEITETRVGEVRETVEGMRLKKEQSALENVREIVKENLSAVILLGFLVIFFSSAVLYGMIKKR